MQTIYLDISNRGVVPTIYAKQGDVGRKFEVVFTNSGLPYVIADGSFLSVWYSGESGEGNYTEIDGHSAFTVNVNKVAIEIITQALVNDGKGVFCLVLNEPGGRQIGSWNIPYICEAIPGFGSEEAKAYYTAFSDSIEKLYQTTENLTPEAIGAAPAGFGLGETESRWVDNPDKALVPGFYHVGSDNYTGDGSFADWRLGWCILLVERQGNTIAQTACYHDIKWSRYSTDAGVTWQPWEWVNPPMTPGDEYRTTERWNGEVVYTKLVDFGTLPNSAPKGKYSLGFGVKRVVNVDLSIVNSAGTESETNLPNIKYYYAGSDSGNLFMYMETTADLSNYSCLAAIKYTKS